ncbi:integrase core domain-containing protein [Chitinimonas taiwanensis]
MTLDFLRPGKPMVNAFIESFNGSLRDVVPERAPVSVVR